MSKDYRLEGKAALTGRVRDVGPVLCCLVVCAFFGWSIPPDVNESHYLTRAKHFWDPDWCRGDLFLESVDAQPLFFAATGFACSFISLEAFAWIGRVVSWLLVSVSFVAICNVMQIRRWLVPAAMVLFLFLVSRFNLAGEWIVGGFEAKSLSWPAALAAIAFAIRGNWGWSGAIAGVSAAIHLVIGWWTLLSIGIVWSIERFASARAPGDFSRLESGRVLPGVLAGGAGLACGVVPLLWGDSVETPAMAMEAATIQVHTRLAHHLFFGGFTALHVARFVLLLVMWWVLVRRIRMTRDETRLNLFALASTGFSFCGLMLSGLVDQVEFVDPLLRLYWFRMADIIVPLFIAVILHSCLTRIQGMIGGDGTPAMGYGEQREFNSASRKREPFPEQGTGDKWRRRQLSVRIIAAGLVLVGAAEGFHRIRSASIPRACSSGIASGESDGERRNRVVANWKRVCGWIAASIPEGSIVLTPPFQQTFHWFGQRAEFVAWKHAPQNASGILEWNQRMMLARRAYSVEDGGFLRWPAEWREEFCRRYSIDYVLMNQRETDLWGIPEGWTIVYPADQRSKSTFVVLAPQSTNQ